MQFTIKFKGKNQRPSQGESESDFLNYMKRKDNKQLDGRQVMIAKETLKILEEFKHLAQKIGQTQPMRIKSGEQEEDGALSVIIVL